MSVELQNAIILSILLIVLAYVGVPLFCSENDKQKHGRSRNEKPISVGEISLSFLLVFCAGFSSAWMMARTAACSGWMNPSISIGLVLLIGIICLFIRLAPKLLYSEFKIVPILSAIFIVLIIAFWVQLIPAIMSYEGFDAYHHPVVVPVADGWKNDAMNTLASYFPMDHDYPVIHLERRVYYPEMTFIGTCSTVLIGGFALLMLLSSYSVLNKKKG